MTTTPEDNHAPPPRTPRTEAMPVDVLDRFELICEPLESLRPEEYPTRQALAAAAVLAVDGVGISVLMDGQNRIPLGASSDQATAAESLEFTLGQGPCLHAHAVERPVLVPDVTNRTAQVWTRWPQYAHELLARTPFRSVFAFPLSSGGLTIGTLSLYRRQTGDLSTVELGDALAVTNRIFYDLLDTGTFSGAAKPALRWLNLPLAVIRGNVWQAIGIATVELALSPADALALLRSYCYAHDQLLDDAAADVISRRLPLDQLHP